MEEIEEIIETPAMLEFRLRDLAQKYTNLLICIHDLKPAEREQIETWLSQIEEQIQTLTNQEHAEVAIHP